MNNFDSNNITSSPLIDSYLTYARQNVLSFGISLYNSLGIWQKWTVLAFLLSFLALPLIILLCALPFLLTALFAVWVALFGVEKTKADLQRVLHNRTLRETWETVVEQGGNAYSTFADTIVTWLMIAVDNLVAVTKHYTFKSFKYAT